MKNNKKTVENTRSWAFRIIAITVALLIILPIIAMFTGCTEVDAAAEQYERDLKEVYWDRDTSAHIFVDTETNVMYMFVKFGYGGGLTVMVDENGMPLIYDGE